MRYTPDMAPPAEWTLERYLTPAGECPVRLFLESLAGRHETDALALLGRLRSEGAALRPPTSKLVETGLFELRGHQVRIFYVFRPGRRAILLDGCIKKQDKIPADVLKRVRQYVRDLETREARPGEAR